MKSTALEQFGVARNPQRKEGYPRAGDGLQTANLVRYFSRCTAANRFNKIWQRR